MNYLLLRSNKESGPYTFEQLVQLGLKPYDLVWIQGKSAAWRYPSELEELKDFAPVVEEQPYDRFYKKQGPEKHYFESIAEQKKEAKPQTEIKKTVEINPVPMPVEQKPEIIEAAEVKQSEIPAEQHMEVRKAAEIEAAGVKQNEIPAEQHKVVRKPAEISEAAEVKQNEIPAEQHKVIRKSVKIKYYEIPIISKQEVSKPEKSEKPLEEKYYELPIQQKQETFNPYQAKQFETPVEKESKNFMSFDSEKQSFPGKVFVSMPVKSEPSYQNEIKPVPQTVSEKFAEKIPEKKNIEEKISFDEKVELKEEYTQSLDEIKRMYAENYLQRKQKISRKQNLVKLFRVSGIAACAIGLAALVYFVFIPGKKDNQPLNLASRTQNQTENNSPENTETAVPSKEEKENQYQEGETKKKNSEKKIQPVTSNDDEVVEEATDITASENIPEEIVPDENAAGGKSEVDPVTGERKKTTRNNTPGGFTVRSTAVINKFVSVKANEYKRKAFGGIEDLQLTVSNDSKFILDHVTVELLYLKPSEQPLKTEIIRFTDIAPNGTMTVKIPDSQRGIKVKCKILEVESSQFDKHLAGM